MPVLYLDPGDILMQLLVAFVFGCAAGAVVRALFLAR